MGGGRFKPDKEGEVSYTGISQSAIREMAVRYNPLLMQRGGVNSG